MLPPQMYATLGALTLGATEPDTGVRWALPSLQGWGGSPASTIDIQQKTRAHGAAAGRAYFTARHLSAEGTVSAPTPEALTDALDRLNDAVDLDDTLLTVYEGGRSRWAMVRREGAVDPVWKTPLFATWGFGLVAVDSRKFGTELTQSTALASVSGGLVIPYTIPYTIESTVVSGQVALINPGNEVGPVTVRIDGPVIGPVITHVASGLAVTFAASLELGVGEWIDVHMEAHQVLAQGQAGRANWITERGWSGFEPGPNVWGFSAATYNPDARMTVRATPADK